MESGQVNNVFILSRILAFLRRWGKHIKSSTKSLEGVCPLVYSKWAVPAFLKVGDEKIPGVNNSTNTARTMFSLSMLNWLYKRIVVTLGPEGLSHHSVSSNCPLRSCGLRSAVKFFTTRFVTVSFHAVLWTSHTDCFQFLVSLFPGASSHRKSQHLPEANSTAFDHPKWTNFAYVQISVEEVKGSSYRRNVMNRDIKGESSYVVLHFDQSTETWRTNVGLKIVQRVLGPTWEI